MTAPLAWLTPRVDNHVYGRLLTCTRCGALVDVVELPAVWLDADEFVCGECLTPVQYDPATAPIPY